MTKYLQESRMREIRTSGSTRGSKGTGDSRPLLSTLLVAHGEGFRLTAELSRAGKP